MEKELERQCEEKQETNKIRSVEVKSRENIREYIMKMPNLAEKLKSLKLEFGEDLIVHLYNTQKNKWPLSKFISHYIQEEERLQRDKTASAHFASSTFQNKKMKNIKGVVYGNLYLIHEKSQSLDVFKSFKAEVELQLGKKIKAVKFDRGGEYYGRYDGSGEQRPWPFALFLK
ncbi:hypothetical protein CR513_43329, partial [Mucuna pruriens]